MTEAISHDEDPRRAVEELRALLAGLRRRRTDAAFVKLVAQVDTDQVRAEAEDPVPCPDSCHPAYDGQRAWLQAWLSDGRSTRDVMVVPMMRRQTWVKDDAPSPDTFMPLPRHTLTRRRCAGLAPYVGAPFVYQWSVATDEVGRTVAGSTRIVRIGSPC